MDVDHAIEPAVRLDNVRSEVIEECANHGIYSKTCSECLVTSGANGLRICSKKRKGL